MASGSIFGLNFLLLLFLLIPGYLGLRGYLKASVQLDTTSRIDKLLLGILGGIVSGSVMLLLNRFGVLSYLIEYWYALWTNQQVTATIGFHSRYAISTDSVNSFNALAVLGFVTGQSIIAYIAGYLYGTFVHVRSEEPQRSDKDLEQPWETALRQSALGDRVTVITKNGSEVEGELYRIGSPSEDYDLLLSAAERIIEDESNIPLGVTYHHYRDVSQVQFPQIKPFPPSEEGNLLVRNWKRLIRWKAATKERLLIKYHRFENIDQLIQLSHEQASRLNVAIKESESDGED